MTNSTTENWTTAAKTLEQLAAIAKLCAEAAAHGDAAKLEQLQGHFRVLAMQSVNLLSLL